MWLQEKGERDWKGAWGRDKGKERIPGIERVNTQKEQDKKVEIINFFLHRGAKTLIENGGTFSANGVFTFS